MNWAQFVGNRTQMVDLLVDPLPAITNCELVAATYRPACVDLYLCYAGVKIPQRWRARGFQDVITQFSFFEVSTFDARVLGMSGCFVDCNFSQSAEGNRVQVVGNAQSPSTGACEINLTFGQLLLRPMADPAELERHMGSEAFLSELTP